MKKIVHNGVFQLENGKKATAGRLVLRGDRSKLSVWGMDRDLGDIEGMSVDPVVVGMTSDAKVVTLIGCILSNGRIKGGASGLVVASGEVHFKAATVGSTRLDPDLACVVGIRFTFDKMGALFGSAMQAFEMIPNPQPELLDAVAKGGRLRRENFGQGAVVSYFTGERFLSPETTTAIGKVSIKRGWSAQMTGLGMEERLHAVIRFDHPINFNEACERLETLRHFLGLSVGYLPTLQGVAVATTTEPGLDGAALNFATEVYLPRAYVLSDRYLRQRERHLHSRCPLVTPLAHDQFTTTLEGWIARNEEGKRRAANATFLGCIRDDSFSARRHVNAAHAFNLLPDDDRRYSSNGKVMSDLRKIVRHRAKAVEERLGADLVGLDDVLDAAVGYRNFLVHGRRTGEIRDARLQVFVTESLEFVFGASELLDCGWDIAEWRARALGRGHPYGRYLAGYTDNVATLKRVMGASRT